MVAQPLTGGMGETVGTDASTHRVELRAKVATPLAAPLAFRQLHHLAWRFAATATLLYRRHPLSWQAARAARAARAATVASMPLDEPPLFAGSHGEAVHSY